MGKQTLLALIVAILLVSCSAGDRAPVTADLNPAQNPGITAASTQNQGNANLWGLWDVLVNENTGTIEILPLRGPALTMNITKFIEGPPSSMTTEIESFNHVGSFYDIDVDIALQHPFGGNAFLTGFDVMGVFMGNGSVTYHGSQDFAVAGAGDQQLMNSDGFTRWFNATEFLSAGQLAPIQGYIESTLGTPGFIPSAVLNPYKYFSDGLDSETDAFEHLSTYTYSRGMFKPGELNSRLYELRFPDSSPIKFQFAIIAHWEQNLNWPGTPLTPDDWPIEANAAEAVALGVVDDSCLYYISDAQKGGSLTLEFSPIDWSAGLTGLDGDGKVSEYTVTLYSDLLDAPLPLDMTPSASGTNYYTFAIDLPLFDTLESDGIVPVWVEVTYPGLDYTSPLGIINQADGPLTAFFKIDVEVADEVPDDFVYFEIIQPNGGENIQSGSDYLIQWNPINITDPVKIEYSKDNFVSDIHTIVNNETNDGSYLWQNIPNDPSDHARVRITSTINAAKTDKSDGDFILFSEAGGWISDGNYILNPQPNQNNVPLDITVYSEGPNESRIQVLDYENDNTFMIFNDDYSAVDHSWQYYMTSPMKIQGVHVDAIRKFEARLNGERICVGSNDDHPANPDGLMDPMHGVFSNNDNVTGKYSLNDWGIEDMVHYGDKGNYGYPDPDQMPWRYISDFTSGVPGGVDSDDGDNRIYYLVTMSPLETDPYGWVGLGFWNDPYSGGDLWLWNADTGLSDTGTGQVDDSNGRIMALAVDDDANVQILGGDDIVTYFVLDSAGKVVPHILLIEAPYYLGVAENPLDSEEFGDSVPVDLEMLPANSFGYSTVNQNWLAVLLDNGDGTWSVGIWEFVYIMNEQELFVGDYIEIAITDPVDGIPQALDVDCTDFEIHVLYENSTGDYATMVYSYNP